MNAESPKIHNLKASGSAQTSSHEADSDYWNALITPEESGVFLGEVSPLTLKSWRHLGGGPPYIKIGHRTVRYRRCDLRAWADARVQVSTSDTGNQAA